MRYSPVETSKLEPLRENVMSLEERDLRMVVVAFEDAATWCETLADLTDQYIAAAQLGKSLSAAALQHAASQVSETRRYLQSNRREVQRIKERVGLI